MDILLKILVALQDFFEALFTSSSPEFKKKQQLRHIAAQIKAIEPPIYRADGFLLPAFPAALHQIFTYILPLKELLDTTIASTDSRTVHKYTDMLIEDALNDDQRLSREMLLFANRASVIAENIIPLQKTIDEQARILSSYIRQLDAPHIKRETDILEQVLAFADFCQFDFNGFFSAFDPAFKSHTGKETTVTNPSFKPIDVAELIPSLLDLYYLLHHLVINEALVDRIALLAEKKHSATDNTQHKSAISRIFQAVHFLFQKRINAPIILSIIRLTKKDCDYVPEQPATTHSFLADYKKRLTEQFDSDSRKLTSESHTKEILGMLQSIFGNRELETIDGYNEGLKNLLEEFTTLTLDWILPLQIIKTFAIHYFELHFKQILRAVIVEGYFSNRSQQSSVSAAYHHCESMSGKLTEFERLFEDGQPCSTKIVTGYLTGLEKGMDFDKPLRKLVENSNQHAQRLIQEAVNRYTDVFNFCLIILEDSKKTLPEYINNIRALTGSAKNNDSFRWLEKEIGVFRNFLEIMKKYAIVNTLSVPASLAEPTESQQ